jgi:hypothetical protein
MSGRNTSRSTPSTTNADPALAGALGSRPTRAPQRQLRHVAGGLITCSALVGVVAILVRADSGGAVARALEGSTLFLAAAAYVAHVLAHHEGLRQLLTRSILVTAFALWGLVQLAPALPDAAVLNDVVIVLFVVDLGILVSPWL